MPLLRPCTQVGDCNNLPASLVGDTQPCCVFPQQRNTRVNWIGHTKAAESVKVRANVCYLCPFCPWTWPRTRSPVCRTVVLRPLLWPLGRCFRSAGGGPSVAGPSLMSDEHQHQPSTMEQEWSPNMGMGLYGTIWDYMGLWDSEALALSTGWEGWVSQPLRRWVRVLSPWGLERNLDDSRGPKSDSLGIVALVFFQLRNSHYVKKQERVGIYNRKCNSITPRAC